MHSVLVYIYFLLQPINEPLRDVESLFALLIPLNQPDLAASVVRKQLSSEFDAILAALDGYVCGHFLGSCLCRLEQRSTLTLTQGTGPTTCARPNRSRRIGWII